MSKTNSLSEKEDKNVKKTKSMKLKNEDEVLRQQFEGIRLAFDACDLDKDGRHDYKESVMFMNMLHERVSYMSGQGLSVDIKKKAFKVYSQIDMEEGLGSSYSLTDYLIFC